MNGEVATLESRLCPGCPPLPESLQQRLPIGCIWMPCAAPNRTGGPDSHSVWP